MEESKKQCCCCNDAPKADTTADAAVPCCCRHKERSPEEYKALLNRLNRIEGQVRGIRGMLERMPTAWTFWFRWPQQTRR